MRQFRIAVVTVCASMGLAAMPGLASADPANNTPAQIRLAGVTRTADPANTPARIVLAGAKVLINGKFYHGPNVQLFLRRPVTKRQHNLVLNDCNTSPFPAPHTGTWSFRNTRMDLRDCAGQLFFHPKYPSPRDYRGVFNRAFEVVRRRVNRAFNEGHGGSQRFFVPARGLKSVDSLIGDPPYKPKQPQQGQPVTGILLRYNTYGSHSRYLVRQVKLTREAVGAVIWADGSKKIFHHRIM
jgi:hypothetical protein